MFRVNSSETKIIQETHRIIACSVEFDFKIERNWTILKEKSERTSANLGKESITDSRFCGKGKIIENANSQLVTLIKESAEIAMEKRNRLDSKIGNDWK